MKTNVKMLFAAMLALLSACQQAHKAPVADSLSQPLPVAAGNRTGSEVGAHQMATKLAQVLGLSAEQAQQIRQLSLAQADEEQRMWCQLADTACKELRSIALKYDGQVRGVMTPLQYQQFAQLRVKELKRRRARVAASRATTTNSKLLRDSQRLAQ